MDSNAFVKELSKCSKDVILKTIYNNLFFKNDEFVREVKWNDIQNRFNKLMAQSKGISKEMEPFINKKDIESFRKFMGLMEKGKEIDKKINAVMKEMTRHNARDE